MAEKQAVSVTAMAPAERGDASQVAKEARMMRTATFAAVAAALVLIALKAGAYWATGSVAMLASLTDSMLDGAASLLNLVAVAMSLRPADRMHRFGFGKAEALAALGQSVFVAGSSVFLLYEAIGRFFDPEPVDNSLEGIVVIVAAIVITLALVSYQRRVIRATQSTAIEADSVHYAGDLLMNLAVLASLALTGFAGIPLADPVFGVAIALLIAWSALKISRSAFDQLMDKEMSQDARERVMAAARQHPEMVDVHDLRTRTAGRRQFIQFHLELSPDITLRRAHQITNEVADAVATEFPGAEILIHNDPAGEEFVPIRERL